MTSPLPAVTNNASTSGASTTSSSSPNTPSNTLGPNSFITLLTAQLQAQDPLSPMDPDQMVNELTSINTLQQLVQIRSDMDTLVGAMQPAQAGSGASPTGPSSPAANRAAAAVGRYSQAKFYSQSN